MHVQVKNQSLVIFTFKDLHFMNIGSWKGCVSIPDRTFLNWVLIRSNENDNTSVLRVFNLIWLQKCKLQLFSNVVAKYEVIWPITLPMRSNCARFTYLPSAIFKSYEIRGTCSDRRCDFQVRLKQTFTIVTKSSKAAARYDCAVQTLIWIVQSELWKMQRRPRIFAA